MTAFSAFSLPEFDSSLFAAASVRTFSVPSAATMTTSLDLLQVIGAVSALVRLRPLRISLTPIVPFLILTEPSVHEPESR